MNLCMPLRKRLRCRVPPFCRELKRRHTATGLFAVPRRPAHGKRFVCHVLANKTHGKLNTHGKTLSLPSAYFMAHGKEAVRGGMARGPCICRVPHCGTRQTQIFAVCFSLLPCALIAAHGKSFRNFLILHSILFVVSIHFTWDSKLSFCIFLC